MATRRGSVGEAGQRKREQMLQVGLKLLRDRSTGDFFTGAFKAERISAEIGATKGTFLHHFGSESGYLEELLHYSLEQERNPQWNVARGAFEGAYGSGASFTAAVMAGSLAAIRYQDQNATFPLQMVVWAGAGKDKAAQGRLARMYRLVVEDAGPYFESTLLLAGRSLRPPFRAADFALALSTLIEGLGVRRTVDPAAVPDEYLAYFLTAILEMMTTRVDEPSGIDEWQAAVDDGWWVADGRTAR